MYLFLALWYIPYEMLQQYSYISYNYKQGVGPENTEKQVARTWGLSHDDSTCSSDLSSGLSALRES